MKGIAGNRPFLELISTLYSGLLEDLVEAIQEGYPVLRMEREEHQRLHAIAKQLDKNSLHLAMNNKLDHLDASISKLTENCAEAADRRVRNLLSEGYEQLEVLNSSNRGVRSPDKVLEIASFSKALAKLNLLWTTLQCAEAQLLALDNCEAVIEEVEIARILALDLVGKQHPLYQSLCKTGAELMQ